MGSMFYRLKELRKANLEASTDVLLRTSIVLSVSPLGWYLDRFALAYRDLGLLLLKDLGLDA